MNLQMSRFQDIFISLLKLLSQVIFTEIKINFHIFLFKIYNYIIDIFDVRFLKITIC